MRAPRWKIWAGHLTLLGLSAAALLPFLWMLGTSLKADAEVFSPRLQFFPARPVWENYPRALAYIPFARYALNTLLIAALSAVGVTLASSLVAYSFSRLKWPGRDAVFFLLLSTLMLPAQVTMLPVFVVFKTLGWVGTFRPLIVPAFFGSAFFIFLLRQFFMTIPQELSDAARMDGASELDIWRRVMLPLSRPALTTVALFTFMGAWNDFLGPLMYLNDDTMYTLSLGLQQFVTQHGAQWNLLMAASVVMTLPIILLWFLGQRTFVQGVTLTGVKG